MLYFQLVKYTFCLLVVHSVGRGGLFTLSIMLLDYFFPEKCELLLVGGRPISFIGDLDFSQESVVACFLFILWMMLVKRSIASFIVAS